MCCFAGKALSTQQQQGQEAEQQLDLQRQTISQLALHAERDEEVRQQLCTPTMLEVVTDMLQVWVTKGTSQKSPCTAGSKLDAQHKCMALGLAPYQICSVMMTHWYAFAVHV
jgi:hypothetical protein